MGLKWLSHTLAIFLFLTLSSAITLFVVSHTVLSAQNIEGQLSTQQAYTKLSTAIANQLATSAGTSDPQIATAIKMIITPTVLQQKLTVTLNALQAYYLGNGPPPQIDISDLIAQAQAAGVQIPPNSGLDKPITLGKSTQAKGIGTKVEGVRLKTLLIALALLVALAVVSWKRHRYTVFASVLIALGVLYALLALAFTVIPGLIDSHLKFNFSANAFAGVGHDLAIALAKQIGKDFAEIAVVSLVVGIPARLLLARIQPIRAVQPRKPTTAIH